MSEKKASRFGFYQGLIELAKKHPEVIALDADLAKTTGSDPFRTAFPDRFIDCGISEQNMVGIAAGLARVGYVPFCSSMAVFSAGRAFEIIRNGVAYSSINVKIIGSHGGITAAGDGGTHQAIEDIAIMRALPNMVVLSPCDSDQAEKMAELMYKHNGPVYLRTSREPVVSVTGKDDEIELGKAQKLRDGKDVCIVATGMMTILAMEAANTLSEEGIEASVINIHTIKPLDGDAILAEVRKCGGKIIVTEEANVIGGLTEAVARVLVEENGIKFSAVGVEDIFGQSGATGELLEAYGITSANIAAKARAAVKG